MYPYRACAPELLRRSVYYKNQTVEYVAAASLNPLGLLCCQRLSAPTTSIQMRCDVVSLTVPVPPIIYLPNTKTAITITHTQALQYSMLGALEYVATVRCHAGKISSSTGEIPLPFHGVQYVPTSEFQTIGGCVSWGGFRDVDVNIGAVVCEFPCSKKKTQALKQRVHPM